MAYNKATYKASIKAAFLAAKAETDPTNFDAAMETLAGEFADALEAAIAQLEATTAAVLGADGAQNVQAGGTAAVVKIAAGKIS